MKLIITLLFSSLLFANPAIAGDVVGAKDPVGIKRYEGSEIVRYEHLAFESVVVPLGKMTTFDFGTKVATFEKNETVEGALTRVSYRVPDPLRSSLEVARNYERELTSAGWTLLWKASGKAQYGNAFTHIYESLRGHDQLFTYNDAQGHFLVLRNAEKGLTALIFITKFEMGLSGGTKVVKGEPIIQLDLIQSKAMEEKMVLVEAAEMAKSLEESGRVALYGIYFDFNSATLKSESIPTLEQIAKLLNDAPQMKVLVVGHTDSVGGYETNLRLSGERARAVAAELTAKYNIASGRLTPLGVSFAAPLATNKTEAGRAKNRRVELVEVQ